jgi:hypothetical protein
MRVLFGGLAVSRTRARLGKSDHGGDGVATPPFTEF